MTARLHRRTMLQSLVAAFVAPGCRDNLQSETPMISSPATNSTDRAHYSLQLGLDWLMQQQAADGGWHSKTYGAMECGVGNTALVLHALSHLPAETWWSYQANIASGVRFLLANQAASGAVCALDGSTDYPTYSTALLLTAMKRMSIQSFEQQQLAMQRYLKQSQQTGRQGWSVNDESFGGWNQVADDESQTKVAGQTNISITFFAIEALEAANALENETRTAALQYLARCQNHRRQASGDGGFYFTPSVDDPLNKAGLISDSADLQQAKSYGTATADGLCALLTCGINHRDSRVQAAADWISRHVLNKNVPGIPSDNERVGFRESLRFYYYAALGRVVRQAPWSLSLNHRFSLLAILLQEQRADGFWRNTSNLMKEDDPLIATVWATATLGTLLSNSQTSA